MLPVGARLGPYEILERIGAGGMGEVHKARDTRLDRIVAIKKSLTPFDDRFEREARAIASLNHHHDAGVLRARRAGAAVGSARSRTDTVRKIYAT